MKKSLINPDFIKDMFDNTTMDNHAVVVLQIKLTRTSKSYKQKIMFMHSFCYGLYEAFECFKIDPVTKEKLK